MKTILAGMLGLVSLASVYAVAYQRQDGDDARAPLGPIKASILLKEDGSYYREAGADEMFYSGDRFRMRFRAERAGYLYVLLRDSQGESQLLFPQREEVLSKEYYVRRAQNATFPKDSSFRLDEHAGTERLWVLLSDRPIGALDQVARGDQDMTATLFRRYTDSQLHASKGIELEPDGVGREEEGKFAVLSMRMNHLTR
jgi:hypothetical protein